ncbi:MAG: hypothetical protein LBV23_10960, partial [Deltaproteobacteria bacterium]|nr:hypothetical protein [Deltaproteobacteria bacterium]
MSLFDSFNRLSLALYRSLKGPAGSYCRLETADDEQTLVGDDGSLIGAFDIRGLESQDFLEREAHISACMTEKVGPLLEREGHYLSMVFEYDPFGAEREIKASFGPSYKACSVYGLNFNHILKDWEKTLLSYCGSEKLTITLQTSPLCLSPSERTYGRDRERADFFHQGRVQDELSALKPLREAHSGAMSALGSALKLSGFNFRLLKAWEVLKRARLGLDPSTVPYNYRPLIYPMERAFKVPEEGDNIATFIGYPTIESQLFPHEAKIVDRHLILIGSRLHAPFFLSLPPRNSAPFSHLFKLLALREDKIPLRYSLNLGPLGLKGTLIKSSMARILSFASSENKTLVSAINALRELSESGETICALSMAFDTFIDLNEEIDLNQAEKILRKRLNLAAREVGGWGRGEVRLTWGDPLLGVCATIAALTLHHSPAPKAAAPLREVWRFTPLRPASPFPQGSLALRSEEGKIMPFAPNSSRQSAWIDIGLAPMGAGKSVLLNSINLAFLLGAGTNELPYLSIIDVGPSSSGLIKLIRASLSEDKRHLAQYHRLTFDSSQSLNPFDTPLGLRAPLSRQRTFLVNLLCLLA